MSRSNRIILYFLITGLFLSFCPFTYESSRIKVFLLELILPWIFSVCLYYNLRQGFPSVIFTSSFLAFFFFFLLALPLYFYNPFRYPCFEKLILNFLFLMFLYVMINLTVPQVITLGKLILIISIPIFIYGGIQLSGWDIIHSGNEYLKQGRIYSFFFNPNDLALFTNFIFFLSLSYYKKYKKIRFLLLSLIALFILLGTKSGSGGVAFILGGFLFLSIIFPKYRFYWGCLFMIFLLSVFGLIMAQRGESLFYRLFLWRDSLKAIKLHPVRGWGLGSFQYVFPYFRKPDIFMILKTHQVEFIHPENYFIHLLFQGGVIYLSSFLIANFLLLTKLFSNRDGQIYGVLMSLFLFQNLFSETFASFLPFICYVLVIAMGLVRITPFLKPIIVEMKFPFLLMSVFCFIIASLIISIVGVRLFVADIYLNRAIYNSQSINFAQAEKFYKKSISWNYFSPLAHYLLANLYLEKGNQEDLYRALQYYTDVENMAGDYLQVYFFKWIVLHRLGDDAFADRYFQKAFRNDPYIFYWIHKLFLFNDS